ncbi:hypothetical protein PF010_g23482 [Phytophthora fragariae]|uniref:Uncharacterized protein n=1 Tax=Phytophthora fragariae TaxID=53985 RepID=A0A6A3IG88_9STRA|nr:hypothetical protein PF011_g22829 [Phytophthora fragariae]KAE9077503.1 hypothetical protein PF010_g23482 [Phytophthora fragariae]KAE9186936.1 hypothetical protein PF004_g22942 [Phytophthora fragariae]
MPIVKKLETTVQKDPGFFKKLFKKKESLKKLAKDPQVAQVSAMMEKNNLQFTKDSVNQLRSAAGKDPAKRGALETIERISQMGLMATFAGGALLLVVAVVYGLYAAISQQLKG